VIEKQNDIHELPSPFPMTGKTGVIIVDNQCSCGHCQSLHFDLRLGKGWQTTEGMDAEGIAVDYGHGGCSMEGCQCNHYRFDHFIFQAGGLDPEPEQAPAVIE